MMKENTDVINFLVKPNSSENEIVGLHDEFIKIKINATPEKGKANQRLIAYLSEILQISKKDIQIIYGEFSNIKKIKFKNKSKDEIFSILKNKIKTT